MDSLSAPGQAFDPIQQEDAADLLSFLEDLDSQVAPSCILTTDNIALANLDVRESACAVRSLPQTDRAGLTAWAPLGHSGAEAEPAIFGTNEGGKELSGRSMHVRCHWSSATQQPAVSRSRAVMQLRQPLQHQAEDVALLLHNKAPMVIPDMVPSPAPGPLPQAWPTPSSDHTSLQAYPQTQTPVLRGIPLFHAGEGVPRSHVEAPFPPPWTRAVGPMQRGGSQEEGESCSSDEERSELMHQSGSTKGRKTESWRANNRRAQKAFRVRQKEKQRAIEIALEDMSQRVADLEQEKERLQTALESATRSIQRSKVAAKERSAVAVTVACGPGDAPVQMTSEKLQALDVQGIAHIWKGLVRNLAILIPEAERDRQGTYAKRLEGLAADGCALMWALVDLNPTALASFVSCNLEEPSQPRKAKPHLWACILERLELGAEQQGALAVTRRSLLANVGALLADREGIVAQAQRMAGESSASDAELASLVDQVHANAQAMQLCTAFYISQVYAEILTPLQCARFFHQCYPGGPDMLSLMAAAAAAANEPRAADIYRAVQRMSGTIRPSSEWRRALVQPISRMRCGSTSVSHAASQA